MKEETLQENKKHIVDAWAQLRKTNSTIPDDLLDLMKDLPIAYLEKQNQEKQPIETYDDAWKRLLYLSDGYIEAGRILGLIRDHWKSQINNVKGLHFKDGKPTGYGSELEGMPSYNFCSELEANLANAIFLIYKENGKFDETKFRTVFQMVLTLLDIDSEWRF